MTVNDTLRQCKKIIKARKKNKALYTKADIAYVKMIKNAEKKTTATSLVAQMLLLTASDAGALRRQLAVVSPGIPPIYQRVSPNLKVCS